MTSPSGWLRWVVVGAVIVGVVASISDDDGAADPSNNESAPSRPTAELVDSVTDGDTILLRNGDSVRLVGIDAPEHGECGYERARQHLSRLVVGKRVTLTAPVRDRDRYDRLLRYVDVADTDAGRDLIRSGLAIARYDSRDGYEHHPRQGRYIGLDRSTPNVSCAPAPLVDLTPAEAPTPRDDSCASGYSPCIPSYPPDLDCADTGPVSVSGPDPHGLDADGDGLACGGD